MLKNKKSYLLWKQYFLDRKVIYFLLISFVIVFFYYFSCRDLPYFTSLRITITSHALLSAFLFPLTFGYVYCFKRLFTNELIYQRFSSHKQYLKQTLPFLVLTLTVFYLFFIMILFIVANFLTTGDFTNLYLADLDMKPSLYFFYTAFKLYCFLLMYSLLNFFLYQLLPKSSLLLGNVILWFLIYASADHYKTIQTLRQMSWHFGSYVTDSLNFSSKTLNYTCFGLFIIVLLILIGFLSQVEKRKRE